MTMNRVSPIVFTLLVATTGAAAGQSPPTGTIVAGPLAARADSALRGLEAQGMSGVFLVAQGGKIILQKGYGLANRATRRAFTPDVITQIGSCTKDFTAVAILQLAAQDKLSVDDPISKWFPGAPADKRNITVNELLNHTAGLEEYSGTDFAPVSRNQVVAQIMASRLRSAPGAEEHYSNAGYSLLAAVIEMISGGSYDVYVRDNILKPLGLRETGFLLPKFDPARVSHGYNATGDNGTIIEKPHAADGPYWNLRGNGGMVSTVSDMYRFYDALFTTEKLVRFDARHGRFPPNQPIGLAGSDNTSFFLYEREPLAGIAYIIATNNAAFQGPRVRLPLEHALGLGGNGSGEGRLAAGAGGVAGPVTMPATPAGAAFTRYTVAFNSGDTTTMMTLFTDHFAPNPQAPSMAQRLATYRRMLGNIGRIVPTGVDAPDDNHITVLTKNKNGDVIAIALTVEPTGEHRIVGMAVTVH